PSSSHAPALTPHYTLPLHDALPILLNIYLNASIVQIRRVIVRQPNLVWVLVYQSSIKLWKLIDAISMSVQNLVWVHVLTSTFLLDRKSTRLNSSHVKTSYAVFCLKT